MTRIGAPPARSRASTDLRMPSRARVLHFFDQFTAPMTAWWRVLGDPVIAPQLRQVVGKACRVLGGGFGGRSRAPMPKFSSITRPVTRSILNGRRDTISLAVPKTNQGVG